MNLRLSLSAKLGTPVDDFELSFAKLNEQKGVTDRNLMDAIVVICQKIDEIEKVLEKAKLTTPNEDDELKADEMSLFNPLNEDLTVGYKDDNNKDQKITLLSHQISRHPVWLGNLLSKRLVEALAHERQIDLMSEKDKSDLRAEIEI
jgi:hypothetical protein